MTTDLFLQQFEDDLTSALTNAYEDIGWTQPVKAKLGNGAGVVIVPPADAKFPGALYAYNTDNGGRKNVFQVVNSHAGIPYNNDWAETRIKLAYPPGERQYLHIVWIDMEGLYQTKGMMPSQYEHEINKYLSPERWTPLRITAGTGLGLNLIGGWLQAGLALVYLPNTTGIIDMTSHRPSTSNMARYCMVYYDPDTDTFGAVDGDDFDNAEQVEIETFMPTTVPAGAMVLGHVRLHQGQTGWGDSDIVRPALPFFTPPGIVPPQLGGGGFDLTTIQGFLFYNGVNTYQVHCVGDQTAAPTVNDDETSAPHPFGVLSLWVTSVTAGAAEDAVYMCVDPTDGAAVWLRLDGASGGGTVTSVGLTMPTIFSVLGTPVTTSGTLAVSLNNQSGNVIFASPANGSNGIPTFRAMVAADIPDNSITAARLADIAGLSVLGRASSGTGDPGVITFTADNQFLVRRSGALTVGAIVSADLTTALTTPPAIGGTTPAAGTFTDLTVLDSSPTLVINSPTVVNRVIQFQTNGSPRWAVYATADAESGSNAGTNLMVARYTDGGAVIGNVVVINRDSGKVFLTNDLQIGGALTINLATVGTRPLFFDTNGVHRWVMYASADAESGSNAGTNLLIGNYSDGGTFLSNVFNINRASGKVDLWGELQIDSASAGGALYLGHSGTNGSWRFIPSGANLVIQKRELGTWVTKSTITA